MVDECDGDVTLAMLAASRCVLEDCALAAHTTVSTSAFSSRAVNASIGAEGQPSVEGQGSVIGATDEAVKYGVLAGLADLIKHTATGLVGSQIAVHIAAIPRRSVKNPAHIENAGVRLRARFATESYE